jgi:hypothetical protein
MKIVCLVGTLTLYLASATAGAQQNALVLACRGTVTTGSEEPQQITMGIIVNFTTRRVQGLQAPGVLDYPLAISAADDAMITFQGSQKMGNSSVSTLGTIDRVNGDVDFTNMATNQSSTSYALKCRPTQRMF